MVKDQSIDGRWLALKRSEGRVYAEHNRQNPKIQSQLIIPKERAIEAFNKKSFLQKIKFTIYLWKNEL